MLHDKLKELRKQSGCTQDEVAVKLNVVRQTVSKWETGTSIPDVNSLARLAEIYGVHMYDLLDTAADRREAPAAPETADVQPHKVRRPRYGKNARRAGAAGKKRAISFVFAAALICALTVGLAHGSGSERRGVTGANGGLSQEDYAFDTFGFSDLRPGEMETYGESITLPETGSFKCHADYTRLGLAAEMGLIDQNGTEYAVFNPGGSLTDVIEDIPAGEYRVFFRNSESNLQYMNTAAEPLTISGAAAFGFAIG